MKSRVFLCFWLCVQLTRSDFENIHKRHEYNLTFKGPIIVLPNTNEIPFFEIGGHVIPGKDRIRLTTSLPDQQGWIWSKGTASFEGFQIDLVFKISGSGRIGADGIALWVVQGKSAGGSALGANNVWNGLGVFFDTYDNDGQNNNPTILAIINDGTKHYTSSTDGQELSLGSCFRDFRNRPHPVHARVLYFNQSLEVYISSGIEIVNPELELCFKTFAILPQENYYFGVTAATGTLADDHDIEKFEVHSLSDKQNLKADEEKQRLEEHRKYEEEFQSKLENITKGEQSTNPSHDEQAQESEANKNLIVIWQEIVRQNKLLKKIAKEIELQKSKDKNEMIHQLDSFRKEFLGIKQSVDSMYKKMDVPSDTYQQLQSLNQIQNAVDALKMEMVKELDKITTLQNTLYKSQEKLISSVNSVLKDQMCGSCVSTGLILLTTTAQIVCVIGFLIYQKNRENSAKKFY